MKHALHLLCACLLLVSANLLAQPTYEASGFPQAVPQPQSLQAFSSELIGGSLPLSSVAGLEINSVMSGSWNDPITWDCACVPDGQDNVFIQDTHDIELSGAGDAAGLSIATGGTLTLGAAGASTLTVLGDWANDGGFDGGESKVVFGGTTNQTISGATAFYEVEINGVKDVTLAGETRILNVLTIADATVVSDGNLVFAGSEAGQGVLASMTSGSIEGPVVQELHYVAPNTGWFPVCVPLTGATLQEFNNHFLTTGMIGSDYPTQSFISISSWDEPLITDIPNEIFGYSYPADISEPINEKLGYFLYGFAGDAFYPLQGEAITGDFDYTLSKTDNGDISTDGFNNVSNPYISAIDWTIADGFVKDGVSQAIYTYDRVTRGYKTYINGHSLNGGSPIIQPNQPYWVYADGASPTMTISESAKTTSTTFENAPNTGVLNLTVSTGDWSDESMIVFNDNASSTFDPTNDATKLTGINPLVQAATVSNDDYRLAVNSTDMPLEGIDIPVMVYSYVDVEPFDCTLSFGNYSIPANRCITVEDVMSGALINLENESEMTFQITESTEQVRFVIHVSPEFVAAATAEQCGEVATGAITASGLGDGPFTYTVFDLEDNIVHEDVNNMGSLNWTTAPAGGYRVEVSGNTNCGTLTDFISVESGVAMSVAAATVVDNSCNGSNAGSITVEIDGGTAPHTYNWGIAEMTEATATDLEAGTYTCIVTDALGCEIAQEFTVNEPTPLTSTNESITHVSCNAGATGSIQIEALGGTAPYLYTWSNSSTESAITDLEAGNYMVNIVDDAGCEFLQEFTINEPTALEIMDETVTNIACGEVATGSVELDIAGGSGAYVILWDNNNAGQTISDLEAGVYVCTITDENGCELTHEVEVTEVEQVEAMFTTESLVVDIVDGPVDVVFENMSSGAIDFEWNFGNGTTSTDADPTATFDTIGMFDIVVVASSADCSDTFTITIEVENTFGIEEIESGAVAFITEGTPTLLFSFASPKQLQIDAYNALGQQVMTSVKGSYQYNRVELNELTAKGWIVVRVTDTNTGKVNTYTLVK